MLTNPRNTLILFGGMTGLVTTGYVIGNSTNLLIEQTRLKVEETRLKQYEIQLEIIKAKRWFTFW